MDEWFLWILLDFLIADNSNSARTSIVIYLITLILHFSLCIHTILIHLSSSVSVIPFSTTSAVLCYLEYIYYFCVVAIFFFNLFPKLSGPHFHLTVVVPSSFYTFVTQMSVCIKYLKATYETFYFLSIWWFHLD